MAQIAGLKGVVPAAGKVAEVVGTPFVLGQALAAQKVERDPSRAVYRYHQVFAGPGRTFTRKNLILAVRLTPWSEGAVRPHEATLPAGRERALASIRANGGHIEPLLLGFRDPPNEVERLMRKAEGARATLEHTTADGTIHRLWRVQDAEVLGKLRHHFAPKKLHVLDGHDRYEAMLAYSEELAGKHAVPMYSAANYGLACLVNIEDPTLVTAPRHRILRGGELDKAAVLAAAKQHFIVEPLAGAAKDLGKLVAALGQTIAHQPAFVVAFAGDPDAWKLTLSPDVSPYAEGVVVHRALQKLDPVVVDNLFIARTMPGLELATDIDPGAALATLDEGARAVILMRPLSVEQIAHVDELGHLLPAGSTAFHPPIANGLVSFAIDPDEDLV
ncbi:MAG: DUF1015 family protein [Kofleriaceae bacterium]